MSPLHRHYREASRTVKRNGREWYPLAKREARRLSRAHGITVAQAAGIIASASLNQSWKGNLTLAEKLCAGELCGLGQVKRECAAILAGQRPTDVIGGPKRKNFYRNIMGDRDAVTVDRWAARAALDADSDTARRLLTRADGYETISAMYRDAARELRTTARELQAVVWIQVRGSHA